MFKKIFIFSLLLIIFSVVIALFTRDIDQAKNQLTDKITGISQNPDTSSATNLSPTISNPNPTLTDQQVETELNSGAPIDVDLDNDFSNLETELNQL